MATMEDVLRKIEENAAISIALLGEAVAIPSVSTSPQIHYEDQLKNTEFFKRRFGSLGFATEARELPGKQRIADGREFPLPPLLLARRQTEDPKKQTLLVYGHIDVQPASMEDGWNSPPFELTEKDGMLFGRGTTDDKGPVLCWTNAIEAYAQCEIDLPINIRFILEGMEESGSEGLEEELRRMKTAEDPFLQGIDYVAIADTYWLGETHPCVTYGIRGMCTFSLSVQCAEKDLHSGCMGGILNEAMSDLLFYLDRLVQKDGRIRVPGIYDSVRKLTPEEAKLYDAIKFDPQERKREFGILDCQDEANPSKMLQRLWREPSLSVHGIEGAYAAPGFKTVIPGKVTGKFSIRIVPDMDPQKIIRLLENYIAELEKERGSKNKIALNSGEPGRWYVADPNGPNFNAARAAAKTVYGVEPFLTREGGSIPISIVLADVTAKEVCFVCVGRSSDGAHGPNEKINKDNFIKGAQMMAVYFNELGQQQKPA